MMIIVAYLASATKAVDLLTVWLLSNQGAVDAKNSHEISTLLSGLHSRGLIPQMKDPLLLQ